MHVGKTSAAKHPPTTEMGNPVEAVWDGVFCTEQRPRGSLGKPPSLAVSVMSEHSARFIGEQITERDHLVFF